MKTGKDVKRWPYTAEELAVKQITTPDKMAHAIYCRFGQAARCSALRPGQVQSLDHDDARLEQHFMRGRTGMIRRYREIIDAHQFDAAFDQVTGAIFTDTHKIDPEPGFLALPQGRVARPE
jgi:hypothetical protein